MALWVLLIPFAADMDSTNDPEDEDDGSACLAALATVHSDFTHKGELWVRK
jgi:hypothetical protein